MRKDEFNLENLKFEFSLIKKEIEQSIKNRDYYKAVCLLKYLCNFLYVVNCQYTDNDIEEMVNLLGNDIIGKIEMQESFNTIVFYDGFGLLNRGIATIYIETFLKLNYKIIWIMYEWMPDVGQIIDKYSEIEFCVIPQMNIMERLGYLKGKINKYRASTFFLYTRPDDIEGVMLFSCLQGKIKRYLIDLTDHAFWIGKSVVDYFIEFRSLGCFIAKVARGIDYRKLILLPFYPHERREYKYEGMPFEAGKKFFFSGGSTYKIVGGRKYVEIIEYVLNKYPDLYFVYAHEKGYVLNGALNNLKIRYGDRVVLVEERKDLDEVFKHALFFLSTYPIGGALMVQYALQNNCYPVTMVDEWNIESNPKTFLLNNDSIDFVFYDTEKACLFIDKIILSRNNKVKNIDLQNHVISKNKFQRELSRILKKQSTSYIVEDIYMDISQFQKLYFDNFTYDKYTNMIQNARNPWISELIKF